MFVVPSDFAVIDADACSSAVTTGTLNESENPEPKMLLFTPLNELWNSLLS